MFLLLAVFPVVSSTVNAFVSHVIPPFAAKAPVNVVAPVTANVPAIAVFPLLFTEILDVPQLVDPLNRCYPNQ